MKPFKPYPFRKACRKFHYPFQRIEVEPIEPLKGSIQAESDAASTNAAFWLIHGLFWLMWYIAVCGCYFYYLIGYTVYWLICNVIMLFKGKAASSETNSENEITQ